MHAFVHKFGVMSRGFDSYDNLFLPGKALFEGEPFLNCLHSIAEFLGGLEAMLRPDGGLPEPSPRERGFPPPLAVYS